MPYWFPQTNSGGLPGAWLREDLPESWLNDAVNDFFSQAGRFDGYAQDESSSGLRPAS
jgi:hypothetical protein